MLKGGGHTAEQKIRSFLSSIGLPNRDYAELPPSPIRFPDGSQYRFEIPSAQTPEIITKYLELFEDYEAPKPHRFTETRGIMRLLDRDIEKMVEICKREKIELFLSTGPRAITDTSTVSHTPEGARIAYRLRGTEQLVHALTDVYRAAELGVRGFVIYDEGMLTVLNLMRQEEIIPTNCRFKVSVHCGHGNPASIKLLESLGADSVNPVADLTLPMIASIRNVVKIFLDIFTDTPATSGSINRIYEVPEIIRVASPVYLKVGSIANPRHNHHPNQSEIVERVRQVKAVAEMIERYYPESKPSHNRNLLAIPE